MVQLKHTRRSRNMLNFGPLTAEICWRVWGTAENFNRFRVLASLLHRCRLTDVNQTLRDVWPSPALVYYIYIFGGLLPPYGFFASCKIHFASKSFSYIDSVTARHSSTEHQPNFVALSRGRHLYSAGRPSRWTSAHILVSDKLWFSSGMF